MASSSSSSVGLPSEHLAEEVFKGEQKLGSMDFLVEFARKVGIEGAILFLDDPKMGLDEVKEELKKYSSNISDVPHYMVNGKYQPRGGNMVNMQKYYSSLQVAPNNLIDFIL
ncbi:hypothetical protein LXL04_003878 [Taraxacum kok-saghyz]